MQHDSKWVEYIRRIPFFSGLSQSELASVSQICLPRRVERGQVLFHEGSEGYEVFMILSGRLRVDCASSDGQPVTIAVRGAREVIGEMAIIDKAPRSATVWAETDAKLLVIHRDNFNRLLETTPQIAISLIRHLSSRLRDVSAALKESRSEPLRNRILQFLCQQPSDEGIVELRSTQKEIAQELGCSREALSRNLRQLSDEGKIKKLGRGRLQISE